MTRHLLRRSVLALLVAPAAASASVTVNTAATTPTTGAPPRRATARCARRSTRPPPDGLIIVPAADVHDRQPADRRRRDGDPRRGRAHDHDPAHEPSASDRVMLIESGLTSVIISGVRITGRQRPGEPGRRHQRRRRHDAASLRQRGRGQHRRSGGGIWSAGTLDIKRTTIARNHAVGDVSDRPPAAGSCAVAGGSTTLENTTVSRNTARNADNVGLGGGIYTAANLDLAT